MSNDALQPFSNELENTPAVVANMGEAPDAQWYERGQGLVEYALIIALVAIVVIAALVLLGPTIADTFNNISKTL